MQLIYFQIIEFRNGFESLRTLRTTLLPSITCLIWFIRAIKNKCHSKTVLLVPYSQWDGTRSGAFFDNSQKWFVKTKSTNRHLFVYKLKLSFVTISSSDPLLRFPKTNNLWHKLWYRHDPIIRDIVRLPFLECVQWVEATRFCVMASATMKRLVHFVCEWIAVRLSTEHSANHSWMSYSIIYNMF